MRMHTAWSDYSIISFFLPPLSFLAVRSQPYSVISAFGGFCTPQSADDSTRSQYGFPYLFCTSAATGAASPNQ